MSDKKEDTLKPGQKLVADDGSGIEIVYKGPKDGSGRYSVSVEQSGKEPKLLRMSSDNMYDSRALDQAKRWMKNQKDVKVQLNDGTFRFGRFTVSKGESDKKPPAKKKGGRRTRRRKRKRRKRRSRRGGAPTLQECRKAFPSLMLPVVNKLFPKGSRSMRFGVPTLQECRKAFPSLMIMSPPKPPRTPKGSRLRRPGDYKKRVRIPPPKDEHWKKQHERRNWKPPQINFQVQKMSSDFTNKLMKSRGRNKLNRQDSGNAHHDYTDADEDAFSEERDATGNDLRRYREKIRNTGGKRKTRRRGGKKKRKKTKKKKRRRRKRTKKRRRR
tara:strand:+ start:4771 stop:5751 length:981 start_codon:yes stop_codon:yes gene_type:complete